jgi:hypothetical protein
MAKKFELADVSQQRACQTEPMKYPKLRDFKVSKS